MKSIKLIVHKMAGLLLLLVISAAVTADDIEVFSNNQITPSKPNILIIFDTSSSMSDDTPGTPGTSKLQTLQAAMTQILNTSGMDVNMGYMQFGRWKGSGIKFPVASLTSDAHDIDSAIPSATTVKQVLENSINTLGVNGVTPTVDALYEAALYFRGEKPYWGKSGSFGSWNTSKTPPRYHGGSWKAAHPASYSGSYSSSSSIVDWSTPNGNGVSTKTCYDYSAGGGNNGCSNIPVAKLSCDVPVAEVLCEDDDVTVCIDESWPVHNSCITGPGAATTTWLNWHETKCCRNSDITKSECTSWKNLWQCDTEGTDTQCVGGASGYTKCRYKKQSTSSDTRLYTSPIGQCSANAIILLSDGAPSKNTTDNGTNNSSSTYRRIRQMIASGTNAVKAAGESDLTWSDVSCDDLSHSIFNVEDGSYLHGNCGPELTKFLRAKEQNAAVLGSTISTYTIGFGLEGTGASEAQEYLRELASEGGGAFYPANNLGSLVTSIQSAINAVSNNSRSFSGLVTTINRERLSHDDKVYMGLFSPAVNRAWEGNIKGYHIGVDGLEDVQRLSAVDDDGAFLSTAKSFWSSSVDGASVSAGGAASRLNPAARHIFVNTTSTAPVPPAILTLSSSELLDANASVTSALMGLPGSDAAERTALITWARSQRMGDPLHTKPVVVDYGGTTGKVLFGGTNQGYLHAVDINAQDVTGGNELFAFMPYHLIGNLYDLKTNNTSGGHIYGIDGPITVWRNDADGDGRITTSGSDHVYLYFGLRRGGSHYYALDVTNPSSPELMWRIDGGSGDFVKLGQTWSKASLIKVHNNGTPAYLLAFGGGYDTDQDTAAVRTADNTGLGIYFVNAQTGALVHKVGPDASFNTVAAGMNYSVPSNLRVIDSDANGFTDRVYFGDMGARLWRVDIPEATILSTSSSVTVTRLADFGGNTATTNRRFYYAPAVSLVKRETGGTAISIGLGSGFRANPLNTTVNDRFYNVFDTHYSVGAPATAWTAVTEISGMFNVSNNHIVEGTDAEITLATSALSNAKGWYITLNHHSEKVLAEPRAIAGDFFFTTYSPPFGSICSDNGTNRLYRISLQDGRPVVDLDSDDDVSIVDTDDQGVVDDDGNDRFEVLGQTGIAPKFQRIYLDCEGEGCTQDCVGPECKDGPERELSRIFWREDR